MKALSRRGQIVEKPHDVLKDPYVLEFLGLKEDNAYSETDLETAIINRIEHFLLELGKGFLKDNRQIFARKYQLYLPTKARLRTQLKRVSLHP